jgi:hypothetical protein
MVWVEMVMNSALLDKITQNMGIKVYIRFTKVERGEMDGVGRMRKKVGLNVILNDWGNVTIEA